MLARADVRRMGPRPRYAAAPLVPPASTRSAVISTFRDLAPYLRKHRLRLAIGVALVVLNGYLSTFAPLIPGRVIDGLREGVLGRPDLLRQIGLLLLVTLTAAASMTMVRRLILGASWEAQFDIRHDIFEHFTRLDGKYYDNTRVGDLMARLTADLNAVRMLIGVAVMQGLNTALLLGFTLYRMFS